ncbi:hypothetical protein ACQPYK_03220 [Streptosporangium sp. CA-135522]|uniref:hypothetical protein n=1 Tax=Streptosporangium sp. CA-135522 TaxID=3240072 RepID=UPI003D8A9F32
MSYIRSFVPWIAFAIVNGIDVRHGALTGLVLAAVLIALSLRQGAGWDELVIELSGLVFFGVLALVTLAVPNALLEEYATALSLGWLAVTAWGSLAVRRPFTLGLARRVTPREVWENPLFLRVNRVITAVWASAFTLTAVTLVVLALTAPDNQIASVAVQIAGFAVPALFTARYPRTVARRPTPSLP